jgi:hypothetical protein
MALMTKIDQRLLNDTTTGTRVDIGFCEHVGMLWVLAKRDTAAVTGKLRPIFRPLLQAAGDAYLALCVSLYDSMRPL